MQVVQPQGDVMRHSSATAIPLVDGLPIAAHSSERLPQIAALHEIHCEDGVPLHIVKRVNMGGLICIEPHNLLVACHMLVALCTHPEKSVSTPWCSNTHSMCP